MVTASTWTPPPLCAQAVALLALLSARRVAAMGDHPGTLPLSATARWGVLQGDLGDRLKVLNRIGVALRRTQATAALGDAGGVGASGGTSVSARFKERFIINAEESEGGTAAVAATGEDFVSAASVEVLLCLLESMSLVRRPRPRRSPRRRRR